MPKFKNGAELIAEERKRQIEKEGYTTHHDFHHEEGELALFGACYVLDFVASPNCDNWNLVWKEKFSRAAGDFMPFERQYWKPELDPVRQLAKAGSLIAAEIDRIQNVRMLEHLFPHDRS